MGIKWDYMLCDIIEVEDGEVRFFCQPILYEELIFKVRKLYPQGAKILKTWLIKDFDDDDDHINWLQLEDKVISWVKENNLLEKTPMIKKLISFRGTLMKLQDSFAELAEKLAEEETKNDKD